MFPGMRFDVSKSPQRNGRIFGCVYDVQKELLPKRKRLLIPGSKEKTAAGISGVRQFGAFPPHPTNVNHLLVPPPDQSSGVEQQIISTTKTFRKKN
jgi:hypothetical protein